ncbi:MAG: hypothetical protein OXL38_18705, partial [Gammaproteobacteria bacterium]|nr:hypothetical protein [Gammaproteobacteria bacterium]
PGIPSGCQKHDLIRPSLVERVEGIANEARRFAKSDGLRFSRSSGKVREEEGGAWTSEVLRFSR